MHPLLIAVPAAAGLYFLFRKKPSSPSPFAPAASSASAASAFAPAVFAPPAAAAHVEAAQSAADKQIVDAAFVQFATERAIPLEEQQVERFTPQAAPPQPQAQAQAQAQDFTPQSQGFDAPAEPDDSVASFFDAFNPFSDD